MKTLLTVLGIVAVVYIGSMLTRSEPTARTEFYLTHRDITQGVERDYRNRPLVWDSVGFTRRL